jgi:hypothetical protein
MRTGELNGSWSRYRGCDVTFNALTGTPLKGLATGTNGLGKPKRSRSE